jgi:glutathione S-transferase
MVDLWENDIAHTLSRNALDMAQITLACALGLEAFIPEFRWRPNHPRLSNWFDRMSTRRSFVSTAPVNAPLNGDA